MKKKYFIYSVILGVFSLLVFTHQDAKATDSNDSLENSKSIRVFKKGGQTVDFESSEVDSITTTTTMQKIWSKGVATSIPLNEIDSIWYMNPNIEVESKKIDFGLVELGVKKTYPLVVTNKGKYKERIRANCEGDFSIMSSDEEFTIEPGQSLTLDVMFTPSKERAVNGTVSLKSSGIENGEKVVSLTGEGIDFDPSAHIFPNVVTNSNEGAKTQLCDTLNGKYVLSYEGDVPDIKPGSVVFVKNDSISRIVLVTKVSREGNTVSIEGERGDLNHVFHDISFSLNTATNDVMISQLNGRKMKKRMSLGKGPKKVRETIKLFDTKKKYDCTILKDGNTSVTLQGHVHPTLDCELFFEFYEPIYDIFEGIAFTKAGLFRSSVKFDGNVEIVSNVGIKVSGKKEKYESDEKDPILRKKNLLPKKNWDFAIWGVPVRVSFGCDLFTQAKIYFKGELELFQGIVSNISGNYGFYYDPNDYTSSGFEPFKETKMTFDWTDPSIKGKIEGGLKAYLIPRFYARLYDLVGPCVDLKPYFDFNLGGSFQEKIIDLSEDYEDEEYVSTYFNVSLGVGWGLGFSVEDGIETGKFRDKTWDMGDTFIDPIYLLKSPSDLEMLSQSTKKVRTGRPIDLAFDAKYNVLGKTFSSLFFPIINIKIPKRNHQKFLFTAGNGNANYQWIPESDDEILYASVYNNGKAVKTIQLPDPNDKTMRAYTEGATDVTPTTATLHGMFDPGETIVIDTMGFYYSSEVKVPKKEEPNSQFAEIPFDDITKKSLKIEGLKPNTTYYYRAFAQNRNGISYGNVKSFTTADAPTTLVLSVQTLTLTSGKSETVSITSGSGQYSVKSNKTSVATASLSGTAITVKGVSKGSATITVTDTKTKQTATIAVTVTDGTDVSPGEAIDLGLPSGTLWASCNVGATKPEEYGLYFAWGETVGYTSDISDGHSFNWANYKWSNGDGYKQTKYCNNSRYGNNGFTDNKTELDLEDDAAYVNWGSNWRMPSSDQIKELIENCSREWTTFNGVYGVKFTSNKNGKSIFLPAAGCRYKTWLYHASNDSGYYGYYWSRSLALDDEPSGACHMELERFWDKAYLEDGSRYIGGYRFYGQSVRPVRR